MKNLLIYINPLKSFDSMREGESIVKVQIDNSRELGWEDKDILLVTNFPYEYAGIKAFEVGDEIFCEKHIQASKINTIVKLFELGMIEDDLYWFHDFDAFQLQPIVESEIGMNGVDIGLTDYGWSKRWNTGSFFFRKNCKDIFKWIQKYVYKFDTNEERAVAKLIQEKYRDIATRYKTLDISYNFGMRNVEYNYAMAEKPLKVVHFHPTYKLVRTWDVFVLGKNGLNMPLVDERMIEVFKRHKVGRHE